jgi:hypothetical protein
MQYTLNMSGVHHSALRTHLLAPDGREAAAVALCGRRSGADRHRLAVQRLHLIPYDACTRSDVSIEWETDLIIELLDEADQKGLSVIKFHSHPGGYLRFSSRDDETDRLLLPRIAGWVDTDVPHGSVIMLPSGRLFGRVFTEDGFAPLESVCVAGDDIEMWYHDDDGPTVEPPEFVRRHAQAFGERTTQLLRKLRIAVIGCSGTGSIVIEQLMRLGVGRLVVVDPDVVKDLNLNRIINATAEDARLERNKADVAAGAIIRAGLGTQVEPIPFNLYDMRAVAAVAQCDGLMGCVDSHEGRFLLNRIASCYCLPYVDVGVALEAGPGGEITQVCGYVHYVQPGRSSLLSRGVVDMLQVVAEGLKRRNPQAYAHERKVGYIANVDEDRPAVISVNTVLAGAAVNELLARLHKFRHEDNSEFAVTGISISQMAMYLEPESSQPYCKLLGKYVGLGDITPPLDLPELSEEPQG